MTIDELGDLVGTSVRLTTTISKEIYRANIIGYNKGKSIILTQPVALLGWENANFLIGEVVAVSFLANEKACAFKAGVVHIASTPYQHIHLTYPRKLQFENYRLHNRIKTKELAATLLIPAQEPLSVVVTDISMGGLQIYCRPLKFSDDTGLKIEFTLPDELDVAPIVLPVTVRNRKAPEDEFERYGLEFVGLNLDTISKLQQLLGYCISNPVAYKSVPPMT